MTRLYQIGFNRCGTAALFALFQGSGVMSLHGSGHYWRRRGHPGVTGRNVQLEIHRNIRAGRPAIEGFEEFRAFFDMELSLSGAPIETFRHFALLAQEDPEAKFLLNTREKADWLLARARHGEGRDLRAAMERTGMSCNGILRMWSDDFDRHHEMVLDHFADAPGRLMVFDIDRTPPAALARFVGPELAIDPSLWRRDAAEELGAKAG